MKYRFVLVALFLCLLLLPKIVYAAAWLQEKGNMQYMSSFTYYYSDEFFDEDYERQPTSAFAKIENNRYIEYGIDTNLTMGTSLRLAYQDADDVIISEQYLVGDATIRDFSHASTSLDFFYRQALYEKDGWVVSFQPLVTFPELYTHNGEDYYLDKRSYAFEIRGLVGYSYQHDREEVPPYKAHLPLPFAKQWHFLNGEIAYRRRAKYRPDIQDELKLEGTVGLRLQDDWLMLLQNFTTLGVEHLDEMGGVAQSKVQLTAVYRHTDRRGLQLSFYEDIWGRNSGKGKGFIIGVWSGF